MRIKFFETRTVASDNVTFEKGNVYDLPDASCNHWLNRGVAERVAEEDKKTRSVKVSKNSSPQK